jgi:hypothetical protein
MGTTDNRQAQNTASQSAESSYNNSSTISTTNSSRASQPHHKRGRSPDKSENPGGPGPLKRSRQEAMKAPIITFACHFYKFDSAKYGPWTDPKYRNCVAPAVPYDRVSRIKSVTISTFCLEPANLSLGITTKLLIELPSAIAVLKSSKTLLALYNIMNSQFLVT